MATHYSTGSVPAFSPSVPIPPAAIVLGRFYLQVADVLSPTSAQAASAWSAAEAHRLDDADQQAQDASLRRCDDCALNLGRDVLRALGTCPRWGKPRHGVESRCSAFVAKDGGAR